MSTIGETIIIRAMRKGMTLEQVAQTFAMDLATVKAIAWNAGIRPDRTPEWRNRPLPAKELVWA